MGGNEMMACAMATASRPAKAIGAYPGHSRTRIEIHHRLSISVLRMATEGDPVARLAFGGHGIAVAGAEGDPHRIDRNGAVFRDPISGREN